MQNRVVITGMGSVSGLGLNLEELWRSTVAGVSAIGPVTCLMPDQIRLRQAAEVRNFDPTHHFSNNEKAMLWRSSQLTIVAAREAIRRSGVKFAETDRFQTALIFGSPITLGCDEEEFFRRFYEERKTRIDPLTLVRNMRSAPINMIATEFGIHGPGFMLDSACSGSLQAIGEAFQMIRCGRVQRAVTGGGDSSLGLTHWKAWEQIGAMSGDTCRPFCLERNGTILGEGAAIFVLESLESARNRAAPILCEVTGFAATRDGGDVTQPSRDRIAETMRQALADAQTSVDAIDYINAHGSGTKLNDLVETQAIKDVFGPRAYKVAVSSTKAAHGHLESATGALELAIAVLGLKNAVIPPTVNFLTADPACDLDYVPNRPREKEVQGFIKNSFGFGGTNATLVIKSIS
ncbi:MAG: beta-ketoacyl-[acyl-carrier-protein] synthase family protein [Bdellovibrionales bacterium]|nr:beta-ketoacyl-[acyl-carrier-protein] synthase family protein [Bdellovibrionales bacterium]